ncbi:MAG: glycosyltransferase family 4 protein [Bacteroidaceae bacterium]|nr:glycosyltransferase family 4 protein [Bacteroidaceae bacterium]
MKPSILYLLTSLDTTGGTTAKIISTIKYTKYTVYLATRNNGGHKIPDKLLEGKSVTIIQTFNNILKTVLKLNQIIKKEKIDIVHAFFPRETYIVFILKLLNPKLKIIRSFEGTVKRSKTINIISKSLLPYFDKIIFISKYVQDYYKELTNRCKNKVIVDNSAYHTFSYMTRYIDNKCKLLDVAGLNPTKNIFMHAEIARVLKSRNFSFVIKIAGDGPYREKLEEMIEEYEIQENLILLGKQNEVKAYYEEADIFIHPADLEGFGIVVPEAMSSGLPVILSNKGALPELVKNMEDGMIVDAYNPEEWADAIIKLYNDRDLYKKLSQNGYETYKARFTPEIYAKNLDLIYDSLVSV